MMTVCRIYVEREGNMVKLYFTNIQSTDQGRYSCVRIHGGVQREEKTVGLSIYSEWNLFISVFDANDRLM